MKANKYIWWFIGSLGLIGLLLILFSKYGCVWGEIVAIESDIQAPFIFNVSVEERLEIEHLMHEFSQGDEYI